MSTAMSKPSSWRKEPMVWLLIALPLAAVIGGALTIWLATKHADSLVGSDYYKVGMAPLQRGEQDIQAAALGLRADLVAAAGNLQVRLSGRLDPLPDALTLMLAHPSNAAEDVQLTLTRTPDGLYSGPLPDLPAGKRRLILQPASGVWRLTGEGQAPLAGSLALMAQQPHSSTNP
jgi:hypothetical protein